MMPELHSFWQLAVIALFLWLARTVVSSQKARLRYAVCSFARFLAVPMALSARGGALLSRVRRLFGREETPHRAGDASLAGMLLIGLTVLTIYAVPPEAQSVENPEPPAPLTLEEERKANGVSYRGLFDMLS